MDDKIRKRFVASIETSEVEKARRISEHPVTILSKKMDMKYSPRGLSPNRDAVLGFLSGQKVIMKDEMDDPKGLAGLGLQMIVLDYDTGMMHGVFWKE